MLEAEPPGEGAFECAICHEEIASQDESFLDGCFHPFCLQAKHPRKDGSMRVYECPLCKTPYRSVLHDHNREQGTFRRTWNPGESGDHLISPAVLTRGHGRRRATYFQPAEVRQGIRAHIAELRRGKPHVAAHRHDSVEVQKWLTRELQALLLDKDVRFVQETVNGGINQAAVAIGGKHRGHNRSSIAFAEEVRARLLREDTLQKLLGEHAEWFVEELLEFVATGLTCAANDRLLDEAMTLVVQPSSRPSLEGEAGSSEDTTAAEKRVRGAAEVAAGQEVEGGMAKDAGGAGGEGSGGPIQLGKEQACGSAAQQLPIAAVENHAGSTGLAPLQEALALTPRAEDMSAWDLELEVSRIGALIAKHRAELMGLKAQWSDEGSK